MYYIEGLKRRGEHIVPANYATHTIFELITCTASTLVLIVSLFFVSA